MGGLITVQLEDKMRDKINKSLEEKITMQAELELFLR
jgi:hypothetical protein